MQEITKQERDEILRELIKKAEFLAKEEALVRGDTDLYEDYGYWLSFSRKTCYYNLSELPRDYHYHTKPGVVTLIHFLPENCAKVCVGSGLLAECLCTIRTDNTYKDYYDVHPVGKCPHKTAYKKIDYYKTR